MASNNSKIWELMGINASTGEGTYKNRMGLGNAITRDNGIPLDLSSLHATFEDAVVYAATKGIAYVGQILAAGDTVYVLTEQSQGKQKITSYRDSITGKLVTLEAETEYDVYLKPVGIIPTGSEYISVDENGKITYTGPIYAVDNKTTEFAEDGKTIRLVNSDSAATGTLPMLEEVDGKLQLVWKTLQDIGAGDGNSVTTVESGCPCIGVADEAEEGFEGHKYKVSLNISAEEGNIIEEKTDGVYATVDLSDYAKTGDLVDYTVTCDDSDHEATEDAPAFKRHTLKQLGKTVCTIDIPKELVVSSGEVIVATEVDKEKDANVIVGETYIKLVVANQEKPLYVAAKDLVDVYTGGNTDSAEVTVGTDNKITAKVKISAKEGNSLEIIETDGEEGLYVNAPVLPTSADAVVTNQYVTSVDQKDGKVTVTRKQISYNELADLPTIPGETDFGVLSLTGENAIEVTGDQEKTVKLLVDETNKGNVTLTQSEAGLKAEVDLSEYAKTADIPVITYVNDEATEKTKSANSELAIINLVTQDHTITESLAEFVTTGILRDGAVENGGGLVDHTKVYAEQATWVAAEDGKSAKKEMVPSTLDQVLVLATAETVTVGTGEDAISFRTGHAGLMTPEEKFKLEKLVIDADGSVGISGTISADNVIGLPEKIEDAVKVKDVKINGTSIIDTLTKTADIPLATVAALGVVKSSAENTANKITVESDGTMKATKITTDILADGENELILCGGNASLTKVQA